MTSKESERCMNTLKKVAYVQGIIDESDKKNCEISLGFGEHIDEMLMEHYKKGREDYKAMQNGELTKSFNQD